MLGYVRIGKRKKKKTGTELRLQTGHRIRDLQDILGSLYKHLIHPVSGKSKTPQLSMSLTHETLAVIYHNTLFKRMKLETGMSVLDHSISWCWAVDSELKMGEVENGKTIVVQKCAQCRAVEKRSNCKVRCDLH